MALAQAPSEARQISGPDTARPDGAGALEAQGGLMDPPRWGPRLT
jgi:hypothetical protein